MSVLFLLILAIVGFFVLGAVIVGTVLLTNKKTAPAAGIALLLGIPIVLIAVAVVFGYLLTGKAVHYESARVAEFPVDTRSAPSVPVRVEALLEPAEPETTGEVAPDAETTTTSEPVPQARPEWVDAPPGRIDSGNVYQTSVAVGPFLTRHECTQALPGALRAAVAEFIADYAGPGAASRVRLPTHYIRRNIVKEEFTETVNLDPANEVILESDEALPMVRMVRLHTRLQFDRSVKSHIDELWRQVVITGRLWLAGFAFGGVILLLLVLFAVLKIDRATEGNARGRLALGVAGAMIMLAVTALLGIRMLGGIDVLPDYDALGTSERVSATTDVTVDGHAEAVAQQVFRPTPVGITLVVALPIFLLMLAGLVALLAFKKTRPIGLVMLTLLVVGALVMVA